MPEFDGWIRLLDSRSFGTIWFWLALLGMWSATGRNVLGVPSEVLQQARRAQSAGEPEHPAVITLLDWLSLTLPRWLLGAQEGTFFLAVTSFLMTSIAILGFGYGLELAQALTLLLLPFLILFWLRVRLARSLAPLLESGQSGDRPLSGVAADAAQRMTRHRRLVSMMSVLSVALTAAWGTLWALTHPNGL
ncbi:hypothetical protein PAF17_15065 [Paracoccus sp. Z330]|uniref:Component of SufBCD complex n=1 Tax=Paracoccus onchidii TaxID=3017813 RepID=A0ABT4ZJ91_9RHOB|nr:hypothetical protein [Paracoccus onchidii]MDB6178816.1 hypothetical protein [Paracoccus onchidii]